VLVGVKLNCYFGMCVYVLMCGVEEQRSEGGERKGGDY